MFTVEAMSLPARLFLVKWMSWYLSGTNFAPCCFAYIMYLLYVWFSLIQFSVIMLFYVIRFVLSINPKAIVS